MKKITQWFSDTANVLFDDTKNDLRALPQNRKITAINCLEWSLVDGI